MERLYRTRLVRVSIVLAGLFDAKCKFLHTVARARIGVCSVSRFPLWVLACSSQKGFFHEVPSNKGEVHDSKIQCVLSRARCGSGDRECCFPGSAAAYDDSAYARCGGERRSEIAWPDAGNANHE